MFFFFQAEDGIRDTSVTGVKTCALPISHCTIARSTALPAPSQRQKRPMLLPGAVPSYRLPAPARSSPAPAPPRPKIGRASCREREKNPVVAVPLEEKDEKHERKAGPKKE